MNAVLSKSKCIEYVYKIMFDPRENLYDLGRVNMRISIWKVFMTGNRNVSLEEVLAWSTIMILTCDLIVVIVFCVLFRLVTAVSVRHVLVSKGQ
jgi:hypothetical protein